MTTMMMLLFLKVIIMVVTPVLPVVRAARTGRNAMKRLALLYSNWFIFLLVMLASHPLARLDGLLPRKQHARAALPHAADPPQTYQRSAPHAWL